MEEEVAGDEGGNSGSGAGVAHSPSFLPLAYEALAAAP